MASGGLELQYCGGIVASAQAMTEYGAAAAGGAVGAAAGKKVSDGITNIFGKVDQQTKAAAKKEPPKPEKPSAASTSTSDASTSTSGATANVGPNGRFFERAGIVRAGGRTCSWSGSQAEARRGPDGERRADQQTSRGERSRSASRPRVRNHTAQTGYASASAAGGGSRPGDPAAASAAARSDSREPPGHNGW